MRWWLCLGMLACAAPGAIDGDAGEMWGGGEIDETDEGPIAIAAHASRNAQPVRESQIREREQRTLAIDTGAAPASVEPVERHLHLEALWQIRGEAVLDDL